MVVGRLFIAVPRGCLRFVIVVFPDRAHLLYLLENVFATPAPVVSVLKDRLVMQLSLLRLCMVFYYMTSRLG